jgi:hypothetical protein
LPHRVLAVSEASSLVIDVNHPVEIEAKAAECFEDSHVIAMVLQRFIVTACPCTSGDLLAPPLPFEY